ncbi:IclR family transcriptional regulator [Mesorhizobium comanense]|uniref:IclR family transcriptional regulator n=1 Tax=Mesorhizobium comanense TaxID=2502215 RepID=UPI0010F80F41|nr:IclR family transcriptional regulator [Mesorhizobium comanense]
MKPSANAPKDAVKKNEGRGVQSIELGAKLLSVLAEEAEPLMLKDLARVAGFAPAQAHAYLVSYRKIGLVDQEPDTGRYMLGRFALDIGITRMRTADPMRQASEVVRALSEATALNVALVVWGSFGPTVIQLQESGSQLNMNTRPGTVYSMSGTASGRVFSAFMPEKVVRDAIRKEMREPPDSGRIGTHSFQSKKDLEQIRAAGYATVVDPPVPGIKAISAPVFDHIGQMVLAVTIIGHDALIDEKAESDFIPRLLEATEQLSADLGYSHNLQT